MKIADSAICSAVKFFVFLSTLTGAGVGVGTAVVRSWVLREAAPEFGAIAMTPIRKAQNTAGAIDNRNKNSVLLFAGCGYFVEPGKALCQRRILP